MNRLKRFLTGAIAASMMTMTMAFPAFAARIAFSDPTAEVGSEVTVNMKITGSDGETINSSDVMLSYDSSALEFISGTGATGGAGSLRVVGTAENQNSKELAFVLKFKALKAGSSKITISTQEVYDKDSQTVTISRQGDSTITINGRATDSADATLSDLQISPGNLNPSFSADVDTYTATVGADVDKIVVSAPSANGAASVAISGNEDLVLGENEIVCTVTAQDGQTTKTYKILVTKVDGATPNEEPAADGVVLTTPERRVTVLPVGEGVDIPEGFVQCAVTIDGHEVQGWIWQADADPEYCVFYAMNEDGAKEFYRYDLTEKTLQRYFRDPAGSAAADAPQNMATAEQYNSLLHDYEMRFWIIIGLIALSVILLIVIIILVATRGPKDDDFFENRQKPEKDSEKKPARRRMSREEQYLRGLEEEEEEAARAEEEPEEDLLEEVKLEEPTVPEVPKRSRGAAKAPRRSAQAPVQTPVQQPVPAPVQPETAEEDDDDDDFQVIDLDL